MLTAPSIDELADFTGRPAASMDAFASEALEQSALLFTIVTKLTDYPDDPDKAMLAKYAILEMADRLLLEQPYQAIKAGPFQTETIGSYSYSRIGFNRSTASALKAESGVKSDLFWWDLAVEELSAAGASWVSSTSIHTGIDGVCRTGDGGLAVFDPSFEADRPPYIRIS